MSKKRIFFTLGTLFVLSSALFVSVKYYSYVFSKSVDGVLVDVQRVSQPVAVLANSPGVNAAALYSFAIAIRTAAGEIITASSEDRQWAVARPGMCAQARYMPYPPWDFAKAGTYFNARLLKLVDCAGSDGKSSQQAQAPSQAQ